MYSDSLSAMSKVDNNTDTTMAVPHRSLSRSSARESLSSGSPRTIAAITNVTNSVPIPIPMVLAVFWAPILFR